MGRRRIEPAQGQESVWDYPRPPRVEDAGTIGLGRRSRRRRETSTGVGSPPT